MAHVVALGFRQLLSRHSVLVDFGDHRPDFVHHLGGVGCRGEGGDHEGTRGPAAGKTAADAVGEAQVRADAGHEAGGKAAFAQDIVHQLQGEVIGVGPGHSQVPYPDFALGQVGPVQEIDSRGAQTRRRRNVGRAGRAAPGPIAPEPGGFLFNPVKGLHAHHHQGAGGRGELPAVKFPQIRHPDIIQAAEFARYHVAVRRITEKQPQVADIGHFPGVVLLVHQFGPAAFGQESELVLSEPGGLDHFCHRGHQLRKILAQPFQVHQGGVPAAPGVERRPPGFDVLGQLQLGAPGGAQGEQLRGPIGHAGFVRGIGFGAPLGHKGEAHPRHPVVFDA